MIQAFVRRSSHKPHDALLDLKVREGCRMNNGGGDRHLRRIPHCALPARLAIFRLGPSLVPGRDRTSYGALQMRRRALNYGEGPGAIPGLF